MKKKNRFRGKEALKLVPVKKGSFKSMSLFSFLHSTEMCQIPQVFFFLTIILPFDYMTSVTNQLFNPSNGITIISPIELVENIVTG